MSHTMNLYLPKPAKRCPMRFMTDILAGRSTAFSKDEIMCTDLTRYPEMMPKKLLSAILPNDTVERYLPLKTSKSYKIPMEWLINVINTVDSEYIAHIRLEATRRRIVEVDPDKPEQHVMIEK